MSRHHGPTLLTLRRIAALRELADLGCYKAKAARLLRIHDSYVNLMARQYDIVFTVRVKGQQKNSKLREAIRAGYAAHKRPRDIAAEIGSTDNSVKVLASQMGLTRRRHDPARYRRPFQIPEDRYPEYLELRKQHLTFEECGYILGLLERPVPQPRPVPTPAFAGAES